MTDLRTESTGPARSRRCLRASRQAAPALMLTLAVSSLVGCTSFANFTNINPSVPADRLDRHFLTESKEAFGPIPHTALGQPKPVAHVIGPGDYLAAYVYGIFPPTQDETPVLQRFQTLNQRYYPPRGEVQGPSTGLPLEVYHDGTVQLPLLGAVELAGLTVPQAIEKIKDLYIESGNIKEGKARVTLQLVTPRVQRITVLRQDSPTPIPNFTNTQQLQERTRGSGEVIDLPVYENDVLHALAQTGGLPGTDAPRHLWVFRQAAFKTPTAVSRAYLEDLASAAAVNGCNAHVTKIPLVWIPGEALPFGPKDVILNEGDVVFIPRREEYFYTGGTLRGAKIPLPRDEDIDVVEAIALATGSTIGPLGLDGSVLSNSSPGYVIPPTRVLVIRELPDGRQMPIRVDLRRALRDPKERIFIKKNDLIVLTCKPIPGVLNTVLNVFNFAVPVRTD